MAETIMPCFDRFAAEGGVIGRLLAGYGELEFELCRCVEAVTHDLDIAIRAMFSVRGEEKRIKTANRLAKAEYVTVGLSATFNTAIDDMNWCRKIRNQYAHCNWYDTAAEGVCIYNLEELAKNSSPIKFVTTNRNSITLPLLAHQEAFFKYLQKCFWYLQSEYLVRIDRPQSIHFALPATLVRPGLHN